MSMFSKWARERLIPKLQREATERIDEMRRTDEVLLAQDALNKLRLKEYDDALDSLQMLLRLLKAG